MRYIGLIVDPWVMGPVMECIGCDPSEPIFYSVETMRPCEFPIGIVEIVDHDVIIEDTWYNKYAHMDVRYG